MHSPKDYEPYYNACWQKAREIVQRASPHGVPKAATVLSFLERHCFVALPAAAPPKFTIGPWIRPRPQVPQDQYDGIAWIMCVSGDVPPVYLGTVEAPTPGTLFWRDHVLIQFDVDLYSPLDLALVWLHEGCHAVQRLGMKLDTIPPLDAEEVHETNTWILTLVLIDVAGEHSWQQAIQHEQEWIARHVPIPTEPSSVAFQHSGTYWPELDKVFGPTESQNVREYRSHLLAVRSHIDYWSRLRGLSREDVCHALIRLIYKQ